MSASKSDDVKTVSNWKLAPIGVILLILIAAGFLMAFDGKTSSQKSRPVGQVIGAQPQASESQYDIALSSRLKQQPSDVAKLNALAQEGCQLHVALLEEATQADNDPIKMRIDTVARYYDQINGDAGEQQTLSQRMDQYCKGRQPTGN